MMIASIRSSVRADAFFIPTVAHICMRVSRRPMLTDHLSIRFSSPGWLATHLAVRMNLNFSVTPPGLIAMMRRTTSGWLMATSRAIRPPSGNPPRSTRSSPRVIVQVNVDRQWPRLTEYGVALGWVAPRSDGRTQFTWDPKSLAWFKIHELRRLDS